MKLDGSGTIQWQKMYVIHPNPWLTTFLTQALDGGYIAAGPTSSFNAAGHSEIYIMKIDSSGDLSGTACNLTVQSNITQITTNATIKTNSTTVRGTQAAITSSYLVGAETQAIVSTNCTIYDAKLSVSPANQYVTKDAGVTTFNVSNTGTRTMSWTAAVTSGNSWFSIKSGASGNNAGTITCSYLANTTNSSRTTTIRITAGGALGSPVDVTVKQAPIPSACTATIDKSLLLHIPYLSYVDQMSKTILFWADLVYEYIPEYPTSIFFKLANAAIITNSSYSCAASILSSNFNIHIPDVLLTDGTTHLWVDLVYGNSYFLVSNYGVVPD